MTAVSEQETHKASNPSELVFWNYLQGTFSSIPDAFRALSVPGKQYSDWHSFRSALGEHSGVQLADNDARSFFQTVAMTNFDSFCECPRDKLIALLGSESQCEW